MLSLFYSVEMRANRHSSFSRVAYFSFEVIYSIYTII